MLGDGSSIHTKKWASSLLKRGVTIHLFSLKSFDKNDYPLENFTFTVVDCQKRSSKFGRLGKISYLKVIPELKKQIRHFSPDIIHAHFATSYGLLGALSGFHPLMISVWGSDVFEFPKKSFLHRSIIKYNLSKAVAISSTSHAMAEETRKYTDKPITVIPFGIDLDKFTNLSMDKSIDRALFNENDIVVGTIKLFEKIYGIDVLIKAFSIVSEKRKDLPLKLLLVGDGSQMEEYKKLCDNLEITDKVHFTGMVAHNDIPLMHNVIDVFVALSYAESFGVAVVEAQACEKPVVVSNVGGLPEVVEDEKTGFIVPPGDEFAAAAAIEKLVADTELRKTMGRAGRKRVVALYNWDKNVDQMMDVYSEILEKDTKRG